MANGCIAEGLGNYYTEKTMFMLPILHNEGFKTESSRSIELEGFITIEGVTNARMEASTGQNFMLGR